MIRVLNVQETIGSGGVERLRLSLAKRLDKSRFELKIICTFIIGNIANEIRENGVEVIEIGRFKSIFDYRQHHKVLKVIRDFKPHILHGAVFEGVTMAAVNGFIAKVPVVIIEETSDPQNRSWKGNLLMKFFSSFSDKVIAVSPGVSEYLFDKLNLPSNKVTLINNGVAMPRLVPKKEIATTRLALGIQPDEIVVGSVGRMLHDEHKRFSDLIRVIPLLKERGLSVKLLLVGDGPEESQYTTLATELGIVSQVIFCGYQSDIAKYYRIMDIFSLVSAYEAFGLVVAEAMLNKVPVVATKVGGIKYIVEDAKTGFLVEPYNIQQIADKITLLCVNEQLRKEMGEKGYQRAMVEYTEERYVNQISELYLSLVEKTNNA